MSGTIQGSGSQITPIEPFRERSKQVTSSQRPQGKKFNRSVSQVDNPARTIPEASSFEGKALAQRSASLPVLSNTVKSSAARPSGLLTQEQLLADAGAPKGLMLSQSYKDLLKTVETYHKTRFETENERLNALDELETKAKSFLEKKHKGLLMPKVSQHPYKQR